MQLRIEYTYDPESRNWCFQVPSLGNIGGADTREEAEQEAIAAIAFTLEGEPEHEDLVAGEVRYLQLTVQQ